MHAKETRPNGHRAIRCQASTTRLGPLNPGLFALFSGSRDSTSAGISLIALSSTVGLSE